MKKLKYFYQDNRDAADLAIGVAAGLAATGFMLLAPGAFLISVCSLVVFVVVTAGAINVLDNLR